MAQVRIEALAFSAVTGERLDKPPARTSREEKEARELAECTFAPRFNRNSKRCIFQTS